MVSQHVSKICLLPENSGMIQSWSTFFVFQHGVVENHQLVFLCFLFVRRNFWGPKWADISLKKHSRCPQYISENSKGGETTWSFRCLFGDSRMVAGSNAASKTLDGCRMFQLPLVSPWNCGTKGGRPFSSQGEQFMFQAPT